MEGIFNILKSEGIELSDEVKKKINKSLSSEYKSIVEYNNMKNKIEEMTNQLSEQDKINKEFNQLRKKHDELSKLYDDSKTMGYKYDALKKGVNEKFIDFVTADILKNKSEEQDYSVLLDDYINKNPQYLNDNKFMTISTTPQPNTTSGMSTTNDIINKLIRGD